VAAARDALAACARFSDYLSDTSIFPDDTALKALGYSQADVDSLRAAFTDLKSLYNVAHGSATVSAPNDFFFFAKHGTGTVV